MLENIIQQMNVININAPTTINVNGGGFLPGSLVPYAGNDILDGFLLCNGLAVSRIIYRDLFNAIGTLYGSGDNQTTFNLPDFRNKVIWGSETSGTVKSAGLPNITGATSAARIGDTSDGSLVVSQYNSGKSSGALKFTTPTGSNANIASGTRSGGQIITGINFDASQSNSIYGNSETVQPPAITIKIFIKY